MHNYDYLHISLKNLSIPDCCLSQLSSVQYEFHVSRKARERYGFDVALFTITGNVIFANFQAARQFAFQINQKRAVGEPTVSAAELSAMGLIDEILHHVIWQYRQSKQPGVWEEALAWLQHRYGEKRLESALVKFVEEFPPLDVYINKQAPADYLNGHTGGASNRQIVIEELLLLRLANLNPAFSKFKELFDDAPLKEEPVYEEAVDSLQEFFEAQPPIDLGKGPSNLIQLLRLPAIHTPDSLEAQLQFLHQEFGVFLQTVLNPSWRELLGEAFWETWGQGLQWEYDVRLLRTLDYLTEEQKMRFNPGLGPAPTEVLEFGWQEEEVEQFSPDTHWMPRLVLIAKSTLVWLDQLSKKYQREITRLDQIPDAELDALARWGFTGLWLIGVWERSPASQKIKQMCGNPEASASAYSLYDYEVAQEIGGEAAFMQLKERCWVRGIRLASDMVPNHTGIVSRWVLEHPDWYIQLPHPPFPAYTFSGVDLCPDPHISIYLEDHYYDRSDAAVVFKWVDNRSGEVRYIYHGNDGTSMPWNDTAQLDYLKAAVREAVIRTIINVARKTPIIRFDAAMTLAKRHFHRLWYPEPGSGGDIPSRSEHGLTKAEFNALMPREFWREVVDRVAEEAPDTLLLAEAFWLMEGYFVRTLGMHRVYNSAFMHMLKNEENQKYRETIKNTIEFDPEILKRYVNFMNNPDEATAVEQFGEGDKYFGVCTMLATMPGLPMYGHGQVEGFREKYGMEYRRAYLDEQPNTYLIERHEREIFPLLKKRYLFAEVDHFLLYDFYREDGSVNENVFAYSNRFGEEQALVVYHNAYDFARGWVRTSAAFLEKSAPEGQRRLVQRTIGEGLGLSGHEHAYCIFRDHISGLEFIHSCKTLQEQGLLLELGAYKYRVFWDFREVWDDGSGQYRQLAESLDGRGVPSIEAARRELSLQPLHHALREVLQPEFLDPLVKTPKGPLAKRFSQPALTALIEAYRRFLKTAAEFGGFDGAHQPIIERFEKDLGVLLQFDKTSLKKRFPASDSRGYTRALSRLFRITKERPLARLLLLFRSLFEGLEHLADDKTHHSSLSLCEEWLLFHVARATMQQFGLTEQDTHQALALLRLMLAHPGWFRESRNSKTASAHLLKEVLADHEARMFLKVNNYDGVLWYNKEAFDLLCEGLFLGQSVAKLSEAEAPFSTLQMSFSPAVKKKKTPPKPGHPLATPRAKKAVRAVLSAYEMFSTWQEAEKKSAYRVEKLLPAMTGKPARTPAKKDPRSKKRNVSPRGKARPPK